jgi:FlaA1/EpsC-like NDP-sugar epimerase
MELDYELILGMDKQMHFLFYAVISLFIGIVILLSSDEHSLKKRLSYIWVALVLFGVFEEYRQYMVPNRSAEFLDAVANMLGVTIGLLFPIFINAFMIKDKNKFVSHHFTIYSIALIPLLIGLLLINERPFVTVNGSFQEGFKNWLLFIGL